ncbi:MAG TPA: DUF167 domain-containing protein [Candidatus Bipolaricaulota bacterium]|nr:DUF167 domain-containing protein [Candidatus Bipolaricaulota bacterium]
MIIKVKVITRAKEEELIPLSDTEFKAKLTIIPEKGKANERLVALLAKHFDVSKNQIFIKSGKTTSNKLISINI